MQEHYSLKWTKHKPAWPGFYFVRSTNPKRNWRVRVVEITFPRYTLKGFIFGFDMPNDLHSLKPGRYEYAGPIMEPPKDEEEESDD